ncbi:HAMP domain-containing protein [Streptomyces sp. 8N616]|uniref:HAMP domain-containing protein n=1 Tax=Streptomyces sp. 8N616 TaxID=3457414 RepID=UPI003FD0CB99
MARSITRPLRRLRWTALTVAERKLSATVRRLEEAEGDPGVITLHPVPTASPDEIGDVAPAFHAVHVEAIRLATEQARLRAGVSAMFANLGRRHLGLVERQLHLLDGLENAELDPPPTREPGPAGPPGHAHAPSRRRPARPCRSHRHRPWRAPVPLLDVARAALAEVEGPASSGGCNGAARKARRGQGERPWLTPAVRTELRGALWR